MRIARARTISGTERGWGEAAPPSAGGRPAPLRLGARYKVVFKRMIETVVSHSSDSTPQTRVYFWTRSR